MSPISKSIFSKGNTYKIALFFVFLAGGLLRIYRLGIESLFVDEAMVAWKSSGSIAQVVRFWFSGGHFPTYFVMMDYWIKVFGSGEFALRFPSAIFGILSIYVVFLLGKKIFDERTGLLASYLFATSVINIYYSQCARPYSMALFFVLLSFLFFLEALQLNSRFAWFCYSAFTLVALLISASTLPVLICQILFLFFSWKKYRGYLSSQKVALIFVANIIAYLPFLLTLVLSTLRKNAFARLFWFPAPSLKTIVKCFDFFGGQIHTENLSVAYNLTRDPALVVPTKIFGVVLFLLCLYGTFSLFRPKREFNNKAGLAASGVFLSLWLWVPLVSLLVFSFLFIPALGPIRYILCISPAYYLLISRGVVYLRNRMRWFVIASLVIASFLFTTEYYCAQKRTDWRGISNIIKNNIRLDENSAFLINDSRPISFSEHIMLLYYKVPFLIGIKDLNPDRRMSQEDRRLYDKEVKMVGGRAVNELTSKGIWLVTQFFIGPEVFKRLEEKYLLLRKWEFYDVTLYHFRFVSNQ